jgi:N6-L-threonylcarbamoyladenine synthase
VENCSGQSGQVCSGRTAQQALISDSDEQVGNIQHALGHFGKFEVLVHREAAQLAVGLVLGTVMALHEQALGTLDKLALGQPELGFGEFMAQFLVDFETRDGNVEHRLYPLGGQAGNDIGRHARLNGGMHLFLVAVLGEAHDGAAFVGGSRNDLSEGGVGLLINNDDIRLELRDLFFEVGIRRKRGKNVVSALQQADAQRPCTLGLHLHRLVRALWGDQGIDNDDLQLFRICHGGVSLLLKPVVTSGGRTPPQALAYNEALQEACHPLSHSMLVLGVESSCDETGLALYDTQRGLLSHALHSQVAMHEEYGGVVPELASRDHIRRAIPLLEQVLRHADVDRSAIDAIAYTQGPGLAGALLVGASVACGLGLAMDKPVLGVHHLEGHLLSPLLAQDPPEFPFVALLISGGHTQLMQVEGVGQYTLLGETLDDAAGEAFDKSAKLLGLGYPGGPAISRMAEFGDPGVYTLPRPMLHSKDLNFSFSGLKTAVLTVVKNQIVNICEQDKANVARAFVEAIVDVLVAKCLAALKQTGMKRLVIAGGVGANRQLRDALNAASQKRHFKVFYPELEFCTDNGAMIAFAGAMRLQINPDAAKRDYAFNVRPRWPLDELRTV